MNLASGKVEGYSRSFSPCFYLYFILPYFFLSFFRRCNWLLSFQESNSLAVAKKSLKIRAIPILFATGFNSGVIFVILYSFLMLVLCDQLFILITTAHRCFLSKKNLPGYWPFWPCFAFFFSAPSFHLLLWYACVMRIRTLNIFAQAVIRKKLHHTVIFLKIWILRIS